MNVSKDLASVSYPNFLKRQKCCFVLYGRAFQIATIGEKLKNATSNYRSLSKIITHIIELPGDHKIRSYQMWSQE